MDDSDEFPGEGSGRRRPPRPKSAAGFSAARGAGLVALAVIIGIVLLNAIDDGNNGQVGDGGGSSSSTTSTTTTTVATGTGGSSSTSSTTKAASVAAPAQVTVRVLNGAGVDGVASTLTNTLKAKGYQTLPATNAPVRKGTVVFAKAGKTGECTTVATSVPGAKVQPMPAPIPGGTEADCIVVLGS